MLLRPPSLQRREFLSLMSRALPAGVLLPGAAAYGVAFEPTWIELRHVEAPIPRWPDELAGLRIAHLSDTHRSELVSGEYIRSAVAVATGLRPDLIAVTGDLISGDPTYVPLIAQDLAPLAEVAPTFAVLGNHDYGHWYRRATLGLPHGAELMRPALNAVGIELLVSARTRIKAGPGEGRLDVLGLDDFWHPLFDARPAFAGADDHTPRLVLSHNPDSFSVVGRERFDLMLCGHTHGGQVRLPLFGAPYSPVEDRRFLAGLAAVDQRLVHTNRGIGYNRRIRFGVRPEVTLLTLTQA